MTATSQLSGLAAEWHTARLLFPIYSALAREFVIDLPACSDLEAGVEAPPQESVELAKQWLREVDERIQVHQLRQFLQTTPLTTQEVLQTILVHHLDVDLEYVAQVLEPALGAVDSVLPLWLKPLEQLMQSAKHCRRLSELLHSGILEQGRKLKVQCGDKYFLPAAMVAFTRFSFMMRRVFFHLMHEDLNAILDGLRDLERHGVSTLDCRRAQFSAEEPVARLRMICQSWKVMFHAEYSSGQPLRMLVDLRAAVDDALAKNGVGKTPATASAASKVARAATASAGPAAQPNRNSAASASTVPEFEVASNSQEWNAHEDDSSPQQSPGDDNDG